MRASAAFYTIVSLLVDRRAFQEIIKDLYMAQNICIHQMSCFMLTCQRLACRSV